jgi:hypothetical protein
MSDIPLDPTLEALMTPTAPKSTGNRSSPRKQTTSQTVPDPCDSMKTPLAAPKCSSKEKKDDEIKVVKETKKKNPNWSIEEDKQLCVAWLNTSRDSIVGIGQKGTTFWERVHKYYSDLVNDLNSEKKNIKKFKPLPVRLVNAVECRWGHILKVCNKFGGCYSQVERRMRSGQNNDDVVSKLHFPLCFRYY